MSSRPELRAPVLEFLDRLRRGEERIPLADLAALLGAPPEVRERVARRGDLLFRGGTFSNDGPELVIAAGKVELEIPSLLRGTAATGADGFRLAFPDGEFAPRACATLAFFRKCFELKEMRGGAGGLAFDFGNPLADRRYTF